MPGRQKLQQTMQTYLQDLRAAKPNSGKQSLKQVSVHWLVVSLFCAQDFSYNAEMNQIQIVEVCHCHFGHVY